MLALFWVCFILFLSCLILVLVLFSQTMQNIVFLAILVFLSHVGYKVVLDVFSVSCFGPCLFFFCVLCFHFRHLICIILCLCCLLFSFSKQD